MTIADGEMVGIIGRSGAGKSTLLRLINRLIAPSEGKILSGNTDVAELRGSELRAWRARTGMIFQQFNLVNRLDVLTNVMCGRLYEISTLRVLLKWFTPTDRALALRALDRLGVEKIASVSASRDWQPGVASRWIHPDPPMAHERTQNACGCTVAAL